MRARSMIVGASFGPDALKVITRAFEEAWASIADQYTTPDQIEAARVRLANVVLSIASDGSREVDVLKHAALQVLRGGLPGTQNG